MESEKTLSELTFTKDAEGNYFTDADKLETFIRQVVLETFQATEDFYKEEVIIVDKTTQEEIQNCEGSIKGLDTDTAKGPFTGYIYPRLKKLGIVMIEPEKI